MHDFSNRVLLLSGANGGIGRETASLFFASGAQLVLTDIDDAELREFAASLDPTGKRVACTRMDAANPQDCERAIALALEHFGGIDFLVPSAGLYETIPFREMTIECWRRTLSINLDGVFCLTHAALRALRDNSAIVTLCSIGAHRGSFANSHYSASKGGVLALTRSLARELAPRTRVNAVSPGIIQTPMTIGLIQKRGAISIEQTPLARLGTAHEVAAPIAFLCSDDASFITGEVLHINGGLQIGG
jgi:3-oxoacyl-[acyl-carrier protein] reductase